MNMLFPLRRHSALHQLDAHTVGRRDVAQQAAVHAFLQLDWEGHALGAQLGAEGCEIALIQETEMMVPPDWFRYWWRSTTRPRTFPPLFRSLSAALAWSAGLVSRGIGGTLPA